jgi:uncharacterized protein YggT (Ycf19 family)
LGLQNWGIQQKPSARPGIWPFFISETEVTLRVVRRVCPEIGMISIPQLWLFKNGENEVLNFASSL